MTVYLLSPLLSPLLSLQFLNKLNKSSLDLMITSPTVTDKSKGENTNFSLGENLKHPDIPELISQGVISFAVFTSDRIFTSIEEIDADFENLGADGDQKTSRVKFVLGNENLTE